MHKVVGETILPNTFLKQLSFIYKVTHEAIFKKQFY